MTFKNLIMESADTGFAGLSLKDQRNKVVEIFGRINYGGEISYSFEYPKELEATRNATIVGMGSVTINITYSSTAVTGDKKTTTASFKTTQSVRFETPIGGTTLRTVMAFEPTAFEAIVDDILVKMDKATVKKIATKIAGFQKGKKKVFDYSPVAQKAYPMSETREFKELEKAYLEERAKEKAEYEAAQLAKKQAELTAIAKQYKVDINRVAKGYGAAVVVFDKDINPSDRDKITSLVGGFDTQVWAIDRGYSDAVDRNNDIIKELGKYGHGIMYYTTGPSNTDMKVKI